MNRRPDPAASRRAILESARGCFSATGYAGTSMHDIAQAAGVTQSLIHHHFGPKDALWAEVRRQAFGQYIARQRELVETTASDPSALRTAMDAYFRFLAENLDVLRLVAWLELDQPVELESDLCALYARGAEVVEALQAAGHLRRDLPARFILMALLSLIRNWFDERNVVQDESDPRQVAEIDAAYQQTLWSAFTEGLLARPVAQA
jgi:TetR/AcrR family transcriptional regulator